MQKAERNIIISMPDRSGTSYVLAVDCELPSGINAVSVTDGKDLDSYNATLDEQENIGEVRLSHSNKEGFFVGKRNKCRKVGEGKGKKNSPFEYFYSTFFTTIRGGLDENIVRKILKIDEKTHDNWRFGVTEPPEVLGLFILKMINAKPNRDISEVLNHHAAENPYEDNSMPDYDGINYDRQAKQDYSNIPDCVDMSNDGEYYDENGDLYVVLNERIHFHADKDTLEFLREGSEDVIKETAQA